MLNIKNEINNTKSYKKQKNGEYFFKSRIVPKKRRKLKMKMKETKGITLIALVITIIVLLILAGVTIGVVYNSRNIGKIKVCKR